MARARKQCIKQSYKRIVVEYNNCGFAVINVSKALRAAPLAKLLGKELVLFIKQGCFPLGDADIVFDKVSHFDKLYLVRRPPMGSVLGVGDIS